MKKGLIFGSMIIFSVLFIFVSWAVFAKDINWGKLAERLIIDYKGKILSIEQLNSTTCWVILSSDLSNFQAVKIAENIGYYITNSTGGRRGETPDVHVFIGGKHISIARPSGFNYIGELKIENWDPSVFGGRYRP